MAHILIADDDKSLRRMLRNLLTNAGHTVVEAEDGGVAMDLLDKERFDLLVTDILMPHHEGIELIRCVRKIASELPIIAMSGGGQYFGPERCLEIAEGFGAKTLRKPFSGELLLATVRAALGDDHPGPAGA